MTTTQITALLFPHVLENDFSFSILEWSSVLGGGKNEHV